MAVFPDGFTMLFDAIVRVGSDQVGNLAFGVELVDRYHDGPDVPGRIGNSPLFTDPDEAIEWTRRAIARFKGAVEGD